MSKVKKLPIILVLTIILLIVCNSEKPSEGVYYGDAAITEIRIHSNWQAKIISGFNQMKFLSSLRSKKSLKDIETIGTVIDIITKTEEAGSSFELILVNSDYDVDLIFDDGTKLTYRLTLNNEGEEGLFLNDPAQGGNAYRLSIVDTNKLREIIESD